MPKLIPFFLVLTFLFSACNGHAPPAAATLTPTLLPTITESPSPSPTNTFTPTPEIMLSDDDYEAVDYQVTTCYDVDHDDACTARGVDVFPDRLTVFLQFDLGELVYVFSRLTNTDGLVQLDRFTTDHSVEITAMFDPEAEVIVYQGIHGCPAKEPSSYRSTDTVKMVEGIPTRIIRDVLILDLCGPPLPEPQSI